MELLNVDAEMCRHDGLCVQACPIGSIAQNADGAPVTVDDSLCIKCGQCVAVCPHGAVSHALLPMEGFLPMPRERATFPAFDGLAKGRRSVRQFKDQPVPRETLEAVLDTARFAPTAKNTQQISFILVADPAKTRELALRIGAWMADLPGMERYARLHKAGIEYALRGAPHLAVALADADDDWALTDAAIAISYLELAAAAHGVGACWGGISQRALANNPELAAFIGVPKGRQVAGALMLGLPRVRYSLVPPRTPAPTVWI
jgi:nitroreductase/NAD-dependent dihydropyrimidine dehydrogenase PreA subunit